ncbi:MAG: RNA polymerase sigma factor [Deltaproteobacteria bacterium]|nr:MAG: RNA polymerase sigma factor [Deltaproteobacteria bacterium]
MDFYEVYEQHYDRVRNFILASVKNRWVADDLVQETFLRVLQNLTKVRDETKLSSWIFRIAANLCQDYFRSPSRKVLCFEDNPAGELPGESSLEKEIEQYQTSLLVQDLIKLLPEPMRRVIFLCDIKEESHQEAAKILGISLENVKVRLHRARKQLKTILEEKRFSSLSAVPGKIL